MNHALMVRVYMKRVPYCSTYFVFNLLFRPMGYREMTVFLIRSFQPRNKHKIERTNEPIATSFVSANRDVRTEHDVRSRRRSMDQNDSS
jgi:hypothetical protein